MGELADTNSAWIASRLPALGIQVQWMSIIGDDLHMLTEAFARGLQRSDMIFSSGGLGPTQDDLTREAIAGAFGETPVVQRDEVAALERYFQNRGQTMPPHNVKQAPSDSISQIHTQQQRDRSRLVGGTGRKNSNLHARTTW